MQSNFLVCRINPLFHKEKYQKFFWSSNADGSCALGIVIWVVKFSRGGYKITHSPPPKIYLIFYPFLGNLTTHITTALGEICSKWQHYADNGWGKRGKKEKNDQALKNAQSHVLNVNGMIYIRQISKPLSPFVLLL